MQGPDGAPMTLFQNTLPGTPSGKIELVSDSLQQKWGPQARIAGYRPRVHAYPLSLISPASDRRISSTLGGLGASLATPMLRMHPLDAAARGLSSGDEVRVWNDLGEVILTLEVTDAVRAGVVASEKGAWLRTSRTGQTISALVSAQMRADLADGACFNDTEVEVGWA
jgi:anaerobic selenocysteine-containing dehydrogenase